MPVKLNKYPPPLAARSRKMEAPATSSGQNWMNKDIQLFGNNLGAKQKKQLYEELSVLLTAGLDIQKALLLIEEGTPKKQHKVIFSSIRQRIVAGAPLSEALRAAGGFSTYETTSIQIGEESGRLTTVLKELSAFFTKTIKYRQQLVSALSYPLFVTSFALAVVFFLLKYLVPMFSGIYDRFDSELPVITQKIIALSNWLGEYAPVIFLCMAVLFLSLYFFRKKDWLRKLAAALALRMPLFGSIVHHIYLSRFCQSMSLLLGAKVSLLKAVELVKKMSNFHPLETSL